MAQLIDIFAGPGGLSEGFSSIRKDNEEAVFQHALSIEMEQFAFETLKLRTFFRCFPKGKAPEAYYQCLRREISCDELYEKHPVETARAKIICWRARLGPDGEEPTTVHDRISKALAGDKNWVLIGGPPCQAYSLAGRSRNRGNADYVPANDVRQKLYVEYLQILADHRPAVFVMENVKGLLSATLNNVGMFHRILEDLQNPLTALKREGRTICNDANCGYKIYSLTESEELTDKNILSSIIRAEEYGIPQTRHRVILLGIRDDFPTVKPDRLIPCKHVSVADVIGTLPPLRSGLSKIPDSAVAWEKCLHSQADTAWTDASVHDGNSKAVHELIHKYLTEIKSPSAGRGGEYIECDAKASVHTDWYYDSRLSGVCNHNTRGHIAKDLYRYLYAACYAEIHDNSPSLRNFPRELLPEHMNVESALEHGSNFSDRFRVQVKEHPGTTVVSHISKDGHYYIHYDPSQCRSFTVREAARIQTFPDNYLFCGPRTAQYVQVGNAVPPLLAKQIGEIVVKVLDDCGIK